MCDMVCVLGHWHEVRLTDELEDKDHGDFDTDTKLIRVNRRSRERDATGMHEIIHAIFDRSGWSEKLGEEVEEALATVLENGLHPIYGKKLSQILTRRKVKK